MYVTVTYADPQNKIPSIKDLRAATLLSLVDAKKLIDDFHATGAPSTYSDTQPLPPGKPDKYDVETPALRATVWLADPATMPASRIASAREQAISSLGEMAVALIAESRFGDATAVTNMADILSGIKD